MVSVGFNAYSKTYISRCFEYIWKLDEKKVLLKKKWIWYSGWYKGNKLMVLLMDVEADWECKRLELNGINGNSSQNQYSRENFSIHSKKISSLLHFLPQEVSYVCVIHISSLFSTLPCKVYFFKGRQQEGRVKRRVVL